MGYIMTLESVIASIGLSAVISLGTFGLSPTASDLKPLGSHEISLVKRYEDPWVNEVFSDNILLTLHYLDGTLKRGDRVDWGKIREPFRFSFTLAPNETFAFHEDVFPQYEGKVVKTTNAHFNYADGFKFSGLLYGDGVCHLASLLYWVAKDADLSALAPTNHDFRSIPQIPREFGVSIFSLPGNKQGNALQNLYVTNNREKSLVFSFDYTGETLTLSIFGK